MCCVLMCCLLMCCLLMCCVLGAAVLVLMCCVRLCTLQVIAGHLRAATAVANNNFVEALHHHQEAYVRLVHKLRECSNWVMEALRGMTLDLRLVAESADDQQQSKVREPLQLHPHRGSAFVSLPAMTLCD